MTTSLRLFALVGLLAALQGVLCAGDAWQEHIRSHVRIHIFTKETSHLVVGPQALADLDKQNVLDSGYVAGLPTKVLIHGFSNSIKSDSMQLLKNAYFKKEENANVIVIDWSDLNPAPLYFASLYNAGCVGERVAEFIDFLVNEGLLTLDNLHLVGHSLGAHVAGVAGEKLQSGRIPRITGLDPARPFLNMKTTEGRLSADDADLVDVIHTNGALLGAQPAVGHVDFYPNGGKKQPGCGFDLIGTCSHGRSYELFVESILDAEAFKDAAVLCEDEWAAIHQRCEASDDTATLGEYLTYAKEGAYYLTTRSSSPFSKV